MIVLSIVLILSITASVMDFIVSNNIHLAKTVVIQSGGSLEQPDGSFMIKDEYGPLMDSFVDFETAEEKWNLDLEYGDSVFIIYKLLPYEISPQPIEIYFMMKF